MADNDNLPKTDGLSEILASITGNKELMEKISGIMGGAPSEAEAKKSETQAPSGIGDVLSNPDLMAKLPQVMAVLRPMLSEGGQKPPPKKDGKADAAGHRMALLYALKPYLSPKRCEAIDYIARISKMGDLMKNIKL